MRSRADRVAKTDIAFRVFGVFRGPMSSGPVAVIDIGSNTIKLLVAVRAVDGSLLALESRAIDARISTGISQSIPQLSEEAMARGTDAVRTLIQSAAPYGPSRTVLVATSAVRDAANGTEFRERIRAATGLEPRVLTGDEEANYIGRGLTTDPALREHRDFYLFDLGGGSLECLAFRDRRIEQGVSLPLGCVRLTERFIPDPYAPFGRNAQQMIAEHARAVLAASPFTFGLGRNAVAVGTGGTLTTARAVRGAREGQPFEKTDPVLRVAEMQGLLDWIGALPLAERRRVPGLPVARADVFPTALATLIAVAESGGFTAYHNSLYNLRFGVADELMPPTS